MRSSVCCAVAVFALLLAGASPSQAQAPNANPADQELPPDTLGSSDHGERWNGKNIKTVCDYRWPGQPHSAADCIRRHQDRIGRPMTGGDLQDLEAVRAQKREEEQEQRRSRQAGQNSSESQQQ